MPLPSGIGNPLLVGSSAPRYLGVMRGESTIRSKANPMARCVRAITRLIALALCFSVLLAVVYRTVPPPITPLMFLRLFEGEGITKDWVSYDSISPNLARAVIAAEDSGFCEHWGFEFGAIEQAWKRLLSKKSMTRLKGGSTISNQTAKNVFLWPGDYLATRIARKLVEPYFTLLIEFFWTKKRILEVYLNVVEWGPGIYGAEAAARTYFKKPAGALTRREAALLAAVLPNPRRLNAGNPTGYVRNRASTIQARMNDVMDPTGEPCRHR